MEEMSAAGITMRKLFHREGESFAIGFDVVIEGDAFWKIPHGFQVDLCQNF